MEGSKSRSYLAQERKMTELVRDNKMVLSQLLKELVIPIRVQVSGPAGLNGVNAGLMKCHIAKEDVKTYKQMFYQVKSKIVEKAKVMKRKVVDLLWKVKDTLKAVIIL